MSMIDETLDRSQNTASPGVSRKAHKPTSVLGCSPGSATAPSWSPTGLAACNETLMSLGVAACESTHREGGAS